MSINDGMFSSKTDDHATPQDFFNKLDEEFHFTLDPCATRINKKCKSYFSVKEDGLKQAWNGNVVFMNPPYGREISKWMKKAYDEWSIFGVTVVCLVPARTDTRWWHDYSMKGEVRLIKGRLKFGDAKNSAPFPSAIVIFGDKKSDVRPYGAMEVR